jgi:putative endonuclease
MSDFLQLGERGEALAWNYLRKQGYEIIEKNFRTCFGEIDVVARKQGTIVFVEVKTRSNHRFGLPEEAIDWKKRRKLVQVAQAFLQAKRLEESPARFDILSLTWEGAGEPRFALIEDAFTLEET